MSYRLSFVRAGLILGLLIANPLIASAAPPASLTDDSSGTKFDGTQTANGVTYQCIGAGIRKVYFFISVYAMVFCVEPTAVKPISDYVAAQKVKTPNASDLADKLADDDAFYSAIESAPGGRFVIEHLVRNITKEDMAKAFRESLGKILPPDKVEKLVSIIPGDPKSGQEVKMYSSGNTLTIDIAGVVKKIDDAEIASKIWTVWLNKDSVSPTLKKSIAKTAAQGL